MSRVSVIIPLYNCEPYVAQAVQSVLNQSHRDLEIIVVNDGSTDNSLGALAPFQNDIKIISQPNSGVAVARNTGLRAATGELIAFLDADDWWEPNKLSMQLAALERFPEAMLCFSDFSVVDQSGSTTLPREGIRWKYGVVKNKTATPWSSVFAHTAALTHHHSEQSSEPISVYSGQIGQILFRGNLINTCSVVIRREAIQAVGWFDEGLSTEEDYDYWLRVSAQWPFSFVDAPLLSFRRRAGQSTRSDQIEKIVRNVLRVVERARASMNHQIDPSMGARRIAQIQRQLGEICLRTGRRSESRKLLSASIHNGKRDLPTLVFWVMTFLPTGLTHRLINTAQTLLGRSRS